jgi:hypothetical protein
MKNGKFDEGEATLRMKITLEEGKQVAMLENLFCGLNYAPSTW